MFISILQTLLFIFMVLLSLFLIVIILLQRGKGGGLVGAFGGMGGSSMFGTKTTDVFLKITIWTAVIWFVCCFGGRYILGMKSGNSLVERATVNSVEAVPADAPAADAATTPAAPQSDAPAAPAAPADAPAAPADAPAAPQ
ncbi:MAG: preprotein translocase subunit SecG [Thermoguttaceae bacterium]|nr:preprotein translocase subunit SecG [Thermoguttaceae bacterium]